MQLPEAMFILLVAKSDEFALKHQQMLVLALD